MDKTIEVQETQNDIVNNIVPVQGGVRGKVVDVESFPFMDNYHVSITLSCLGIGKEQVITLVEMIGKWIEIKESVERE
jgi:hypothetical protein